jgi:hypothetical protein
MPDETRLSRSRRARARHPGPGVRWTWLAVAVSLILFFALGAWVAQSGEGGSKDPMDRAVVHAQVESWRGRWPQLPGPASRYVSLSASLKNQGSRLDAVREALILSPSNTDLWCLWLAEGGGPGSPSTAKVSDRLNREELAVLLSKLDPPEICGIRPDAERR